MTTDNILVAISRAMPDLRQSERRVASVVLEDPDRVTGLSMAALAKAAETSEPTVMRFCTGVGCEGYQAFKLRLAQALALGIPAMHSAISAGDQPGELVQKILDHTITSLDHVRTSIDAVAVEAAIDALAAATEILFIGFGASGIIAQDAEQKFPLFGVPCRASSDAHQQVIAASMLKQGSACVAISNTGRTRFVTDVARLARQNGATVIGITGSKNDLYDACDIGVVVSTEENTDFYTPTLSRIAALVIIDILATGVALRQPSEYLTRLQQMKEQLTAMRGEMGVAEWQNGPRPPAGKEDFS
ncbi:SIS domain-containing protein [Streptomyces sp. MMS24-I2-30]|uniref:SIS domain-containing protein n=1 Tax=Streptomyces sp. MMS24-I2-30 TaxID=3351564 RepID=UPI00389683EE